MGESGWLGWSSWFLATCRGCGHWPQFEPWLCPRLWCGQGLGVWGVTICRCWFVQVLHPPRSLLDGGIGHRLWRRLQHLGPIYCGRLVGGVPSWGGRGEIGWHGSGTGLRSSGSSGSIHPWVPLLYWPHWVNATVPWSIIVVQGAPRMGGVDSGWEEWLWRPFEGEQGTCWGSVQWCTRIKGEIIMVSIYNQFSLRVTWHM